VIPFVLLFNLNEQYKCIGTEPGEIVRKRNGRLNLKLPRISIRNYAETSIIQVSNKLLRRQPQEILKVFDQVALVMIIVPGDQIKNSDLLIAPGKDISNNFFKAQKAEQFFNRIAGMLLKLQLDTSFRKAGISRYGLYRVNTGVKNWAKLPITVWIT
jgi:hypothetical protein